MFSVLGIEIEYMLVDKDTLNVRPQSDLLLKALAGQQVNEVELGDIAVSNELVMHVLEFKNNGPKPLNVAVTEHFQEAILLLQPLLSEHNLMFLPTGAHPWMDPHQETVRWPHGSNDIYKQFDTIFDCRGHGWANLQSMHVNLPYSNQQEFCQLHSLIRLILPILPALAASTPFLDGKATGLLDSRLYFYSKNQLRIPSISGEIIPDFIRSEEEYEERILQPMYKDIAPYDPHQVLQHPWLNSRAAIPKLDHKAIEIRILDSQECTTADIAIAKAINAILMHWHNDDYYLQKPIATKALKVIFDQAVATGLDVIIDDSELMKQWQLPARAMTLNQVWTHLIEKVSSTLEFKQQTALELILSQGNLSQRILRAAGQEPSHQTLHSIYQQLAHGLVSNQQFHAL